MKRNAKKRRKKILSANKQLLSIRKTLCGCIFILHVVRSLDSLAHSHHPMPSYFVWVASARRGKYYYAHLDKKLQILSFLCGFVFRVWCFSLLPERVKKTHTQNTYTIKIELSKQRANIWENNALLDPVVQQKPNKTFNGKWTTTKRWRRQQEKQQQKWRRWQ